MSITRFIIRAAGRMAFLLLLVNLINGGLSAGLVAVVHQGVGGQLADAGQLALIFVGLAVAKVVANYAAGMMITSFAVESVAQLQRQIIAKLLQVRYRRLEEAGAARILATLTHDAGLVSAVVLTTPGVAVSGAMLAGGALYMLYLSWLPFLAMTLLVALGILVYRMVSRDAEPYLQRARDQHDQLHRHFRSLTEGAKELKMHAPRRHAFLNEQVLQTTEALISDSVVGKGRFLGVQAVSNSIVLLIIGLFLFVVPGMQDVESSVVSGYVITGLYLLGPVNNLVRTLPVYREANIALSRIEAMGVMLDESISEAQTRSDGPKSFEEVSLRGVTHRYGGKHGDPDFTLGPLDLDLRPGELVFITGGNGSGKSTLAKLILGLYDPGDGKVLWDGAQVQDANRDRYRQLFSAVFSDFHLFDTLLGLSDGGRDEEALSYLRELRLDGRVQIDTGVLSSTELSRGQQKRLALLTAYLEDRPIYLFDEWAADQDPEFKDVFYRKLIPELRRRGKAVVVITHDDRYFQLADRLLQMENGRVSGPHSHPPAPAAASKQRG